MAGNANACMRIGVRIALVASLLAAAGCSGGSLEPFVSCGPEPAGEMRADVRSNPWRANFSAAASVLRIDSRVVSVSIRGTPCEGNSNPARLMMLRITRAAGIDTGTYAIGAADQAPAYTAFGSVQIGGREYRSDLSDNLGTGTGVIRIAAVSTQRVRGTFEFVGVPGAGAGSRDRARVTTGVFDIPVTP